MTECGADVGGGGTNLEADGAGNGLESVGCGIPSGEILAGDSELNIDRLTLGDHDALEGLELALGCIRSCGLRIADIELHHFLTIAGASIRNGHGDHHILLILFG